MRGWSSKTQIQRRNVNILMKLGDRMTGAGKEDALMDSHFYIYICASHFGTFFGRFWTAGVYQLLYNPGIEVSEHSYLGNTPNNNVYISVLVQSECCSLQC